MKIKPDFHEAFSNWGTALYELARLKNDEHLYRQAFEKYERAVKIKPDDHKAINGLGVINAYQRKFGEALEHFEQAFQLSLKMDDQKSFAIYTGNIVRACTDLMKTEIKEKNMGSVKKTFIKYLSYKKYIAKEKWSEYLIDLFGSFLGRENIEIYFELERILRKQGNEDDLKLLFPIAKAFEYWSKNEDAEVLDRLNPEVREVVEDILKKAENKKNTKGE